MSRVNLMRMLLRALACVILAVLGLAMLLYVYVFLLVGRDFGG